MIEFWNVEADPIASKPSVPRIERLARTLALALNHLIDNRFVQSDLAIAAAEQQVTIAVDADAKWQLIETSEFQNDAGRVTTWGHDKVVFQLLALAVIEKVDTRVDSLKIDLGVVGNASDPTPRVITDEIVTQAVRFAGAADLHSGTGRAQLHPNT